MLDSIFGIASPKFKDLDTNEYINFRCRILKDEQDYKEIMHQSIINTHREWNDIAEHWIYECEVLLLKYPENERRQKYLLLDSYENKVVEFYRRNDGGAFGNFRVDEVTPYYLDHPDYPDKIFMRFVSTSGIEYSQLIQPGDLVFYWGGRTGTGYPPTTNLIPINILSSIVAFNFGRGAGYKLVPFGGTNSVLNSNADVSFICSIYRNAEIGDVQHHDDPGPGNGNPTYLVFPALNLQDTSGESWAVMCAGVRVPNYPLPVPDGVIWRNETFAFQRRVASYDSGQGVTEWAEQNILFSNYDYESSVLVFELKKKSDKPKIKHIWSGQVDTYTSDVPYMTLPDGVI